MDKNSILFKITSSDAPHVLPRFTGAALNDTYGATSRYLTKNGEPYICRMGEIHYSRVPEDLWEEELLKMKNGGIDVISSYVFWIHHEEIEGNIRFDGNLNIKKFVSICKKLSLPFILRIGPWVHGGSPYVQAVFCARMMSDISHTYAAFLNKFTISLRTSLMQF